MKFEQEWWYEPPLCLSEIAWQLRTVFENQGVRGQLEGWPRDVTFDADIAYCVATDGIAGMPKVVYLGCESEFKQNGDITTEEAIEAAHELLSRYLKALESKINYRYAQVKGGKVNPLSIRFSVFLRDGFKCRYCGRDSKEAKLQIDHIIPKSKGGPDEISNYVTSCRECNMGKRDVLILAAKSKRIVSRSEGQIPSFIALPGG